MTLSHICICSRLIDSRMHSTRLSDPRLASDSDPPCCVFPSTSFMGTLTQKCASIPVVPKRKYLQVKYAGSFIVTALPAGRYAARLQVVFWRCYSAYLLAVSVLTGMHLCHLLRIFFGHPVVSTAHPCHRACT